VERLGKGRGSTEKGMPTKQQPFISRKRKKKAGEPASGGRGKKKGWFFGSRTRRKAESRDGYPRRTTAPLKNMGERGGAGWAVSKQKRLGI